jgi:hypothetical protein
MNLWMQAREAWRTKTAKTAKRRTLEEKGSSSFFPHRDIVVRGRMGLFSGKDRAGCTTAWLA